MVSAARRGHSSHHSSKGVTVKRLVENYAELPPLLRKPLWRIWHSWIISREKQEVAMTCMNYGYAGAEKTNTIELEEKDEGERFGLQMYEKAASWTSLKDKEVLEVGCGRGGGASYLTRYQQPQSYTGLDLSDPGIAFCNSYHQVLNLKFVKGDAEDLPFDDNSFDAVVNVESSRCYPHIMRFFSEVKRVLRPAGSFLLTDMRWKRDMPKLREQLKEAGFQIVEEEPIRKAVVRALDIDDERKKGLIVKKIPKFLIKAFGEFAGVRGSGRYGSFADGSMEYWSFHLKHA
jgi:ubiquinone/menaquinone biosynthesis C-methylase UbiE